MSPTIKTAIISLLVTLAVPFSFASETALLEKKILPMVQLEDPLEVSSITVISDREGIYTQLIVKTCATCAPKTFTIQNTTEFYVGQQVVPYANVREHNGEGGTIFTKKDTLELNRVLFMKHIKEQ
ncbi:MAG: hypothetical protein H6999_09785 [Hahellaceae bacterium]|nr:hypothetical protein [Hahellaceae bacterium]MCP5170034.1 hypothetical protein [Hahellaceae bacterium]